MKILFFQLKPTSYESYLYFSGALAAEFQKAGHETVFFRAAEEPLEAMERFRGQSFDAIIDFNSMLPKVTTEDDGFFLDTIDAPFFNVILDHPLYHHNILKQELRNYHVLCLDKNHAAYLRGYYPHLKSVHVFPMTGSPAEPPVPFEEREYPLLFTGSYTSPAEVVDAITKIPDFMQAQVRALIDRMTETPSLTIEAAALELFSNTIVTELFPLHLQSFFLADTYLRAASRDRILHALVSSGLPVTLCGNGYEKAPFYREKNAVFLPEVSFPDTFSLMAHAKITLNILPLFKNGVHDRIFSAMLNGSAALTDRSAWLASHFKAEEQLFFYDDAMEAEDTLPERIASLLASEEKIRAVAEAGKKEAFLHHTWKKRCEALTKILTTLS
ncbi:MAG: glycosyltransferase family 1 protein [Lachnospiraceae bacterium]|nr:glycosyltransferase family 1 protein [Lachnospiraceae bacterium]